MAAEPLLEASGLVKSYRAGGERSDGLLALDGIDLSLRRGEFVSIIGPSGCGKSTLLNVLAGLDPPTGGSVRLAGGEGLSLLGAVGYMPQSDLLMPWRSVLDNAALGPQLRGEPLSAARARAAASLSRFGLDGFADAWPAQLSGGMRQRVALLRTFLGDHELLLLDEPFGALDALTRQDMHEELLGLWQEEHKTILFVTHDAGEAVFLGDRVLRMSAAPGRIEDEVVVDLPRPRRFGRGERGERFEAIRARLEEPLREAQHAGGEP